MWVVGMLLVVAIAWYFAKHDQQLRVEVDNERNVRHQAELQQARRDEREAVRAEHNLAEVRANAESFIAYESRMERDPDFRAKVRAADAQDEEAAIALHALHRQEATAWFKTFPAHEQREMRAEIIAERREHALQRLTQARAREAESVDERATALAAREAVDGAYREGAEERFKRRWALPSADQQADRVAERDAALAWLRDLPQAEQADLRTRFRPISQDELLASRYARDGHLPRGLTEATLAAFFLRARDTIEYANVERYAGMGEKRDVLEHLEYLMNSHWSGLGDRTALEHLAAPGGEQQLLDWLLSQLERKSEWARALGL